jgi:hypothetical protein
MERQDQQAAAFAALIPAFSQKPLLCQGLFHFRFTEQPALAYASDVNDNSVFRPIRQP